MANSHFYVLILLIALSLICLDSTDAQIGVVYGTKIRNPPPAKEVIELCNEYNITRMRLYEPNHQILEALKGTNISVILGVPNEAIPAIAENASFAKYWLQTNVINYRGVNFRYIEVGNNINLLDNATEKYVPHLVPAMQNMANAVHYARFIKTLNIRIKVSTAIDPDLMSSKYHRKQVFSYMYRILDFLGKYGYPLFTKCDPYSAYMSNPKNVTLDSVLFTSTKVVEKRANGYKNLFDLCVDKLNAMLEGHTRRGINIEVVVLETGWPTAGGIGANVQNAMIYNNNLIQHVKERNPPVETYIVGLFDEDLKKPEYNKNFGFFNANKKLKYPVKFGYLVSSVDEVLKIAL